MMIPPSQANAKPRQGPTQGDDGSDTQQVQQQQQIPRNQLQLVFGPSPLQVANQHALSHLHRQLLLAAAVQQTAVLQAQAMLQRAAVLALQQAAAAIAAGVPITHNLIPEHLQASALAASLHGTPGYQPAMILSGTIAFAPMLIAAPGPALTVQDRPLVPPVYSGVNPNYPGLHMLNAVPPVYVVENFLTPMECDLLIASASDSWSPASVVGKGAGEISSSRTSSTCYLAREDLPGYMRKVSMLTEKPVEHCELPQVGRYLHSQQYRQHFDAFDLSNENGRRSASNGGQRVVTVLVYLNDVPQGGATSFPILNLQVQPRRGMALVFFPATVDGFLDLSVLHAAQPAMEPYTKFVSQVWIRQNKYLGRPSKRLPQSLGLPFSDSSHVSATWNGGLFVAKDDL